MGTVTCCSLLLLLALVTPVGRGQSNNKDIVAESFLLDSNRDCNGPVRQINKQTVTVKGHGAIQEQQAPTSCTLTLRAISNFDHTQLILQVSAANIIDCDVKLVIYDGDPGQGTLRGYDCRTPQKPNERDFITTGDVVSFVLTRKNVFSSQYDIEILVKPLDGGSRPDNEGDLGDSWGFFREKLENDIAIGIVGAAFLLVIIIAVIVVIFCYRRYLGKNKPWEQHQLSVFRPAHSIYETKSKMSDTSSDVWTSNVSRGGGRMEPPRRRIEPNGRMARPSEDEDSVFDDASDIAPKKYLMEQDRRHERRRERERERNRGRGGRDFGSQNSSYVLADDDHPQDTYVERIIEPRVRPGRLHKPPSYDEAMNESETEKSDIDEDDSEDDDDVGKKGSSEEESEEASSEPEEEEEEDDEEEEEDGGAVAPKPAPRPRGNPPPPPGAVPLQPGMQPHPAYPGYPPMGYMGGYPMAPGQFVPVMAAPPTQAFPQPPNAAMGPGHPPPRYPGQRPAGNVRPTDPPIYSYLVQRGYTPLDRDGDGNALNDTSHSQTSQDETDRRALASGVEYMRR